MPHGGVEVTIERLLAAGDGAGAVTALLGAFGAEVNRYLLSLLRDEGDAAEAFSVFAETAWKALPGFRREASLRTWAFRLAWSAARGVRRSAWRRHHVRLRTGDAALLRAPSRTASAVPADADRARLEALRDRLSLRDRSLLGLRVDQQLSWTEIALVLAAPGTCLSADAVEKRFERLKRRLARLARSEGLLE